MILELICSISDFSFINVIAEKIYSYHAYMNDSRNVDDFSTRVNRWLIDYILASLVTGAVSEWTAIAGVSDTKQIKVSRIIDLK